MTQMISEQRKNFYATLRKKTLISLAVIMSTAVGAAWYLSSLQHYLLAGVALAVGGSLVVVNLLCSHWSLVRKLQRLGLTETEIDQYKAGTLTLPKDNG